MASASKVHRRVIITQCVKGQHDWQILHIVIDSLDTDFIREILTNMIVYA